MDNMLEPRSPQQDARGIANVLVFLARVGSATVEVFLHKAFGVGWFQLQTAAALIVVPVFGELLYPRHDQRPLLIFLGLFVLACAVARAESLLLRKRGFVVHTAYNGWPRGMKSSATPEQEMRTKLLGEPLLVGTWGLLIYLAYNPPLGAWLIFAAGSLVVTNGLYRRRVQQQTEQLQDAMIEQQALAQHFREMRGGR